MTAVDRRDKVAAHQRAQTIRDGLMSFVNAMESITEAYERKDWLALGYKNWVEYCQTEFGQSRLKLNHEQRTQAIVAFKGVGMSKRGIAAALGVSHTTVQNDAAGGKKLPHKTAAVTPPEVQADGGEGVSQPDDPPASGPPAPPSADGPDVTLLHVAAKLRPAGAPECFVIDEEHPTTDLLDVGCPTCQAWLLSPGGVAWARGKGLKYSAAGGLNVAPPADGVTPGPTEAEQTPASGPDREAGPDVTPTDSSPEASEASPTGEAPAGTEGSLTEDPAVATPAEPGIEPPLAGGEAPVHASVPAAGVPPLVDDGDGVDRDEVEGEADHSPSTDPENSPYLVVRRFEQWAEELGGYDPDVLGPLCTDEQITKLHVAVDDLAHFVGLLERWRNS